MTISKSKMEEIRKILENMIPILDEVDHRIELLRLYGDDLEKFTVEMFNVEGYHNLIQSIVELVSMFNWIKVRRNNLDAMLNKEKSN